MQKLPLLNIGGVKDIENKSFFRELLVLALPISLQNLLVFSIAIVDGMMLSALGDTAVSSAYVGNQMQALLQIVTVGFEGAILVIAAQHHGTGNRESVKKVSGIGTGVCLAFGLLFTLSSLFFPGIIASVFTKNSEILGSSAEYLRTLAPSFLFFTLTQALVASERSVENTKIGLFVSIITLAVKIPLNYVLIFGRLGISAMGISGAAISTLIARGCEALFISLYALFFDKKLHLSPKHIFRWEKKLLFDFLKYGTPIILSQLVYAVNTLFASFVMGSLSGEEILAGLGVATSLNNLSYVALNGLSGAVGIMTSKAVGRGEGELVRAYSKRAQLLFLGLGVLSFFALRIAASPYISLYQISDAAKAEALAFTGVFSVISIGTCYQGACLSGLVKSGGDTSFVLKNDLVFLLLVVIPATLAATSTGTAAAVVLAALKCDHILKCIVALPKINSYDWMKNLTESKSRPLLS